MTVVYGIRNWSSWSWPVGLPFDVEDADDDARLVVDPNRFTERTLRPKHLFDDGIVSAPRSMFCRSAFNATRGISSRFMTVYRPDANAIAAHAVADAEMNWSAPCGNPVSKYG